VRLPLGCIDGEWPVLVSDVWPGRSLNVGCPSDKATREKVRALLERQIWPVVDLLATNGFYYIDLHAGNVMVDEALENAWLIDFEGAIAVAEMAEETTTEQLSDAVAAQKADLLKRFEEI
jgi:predicted unusual protein kinase regulating ubiquinone biosynthesis (AarF/ABC1/UbiB family)